MLKNSDKVLVSECFIVDEVQARLVTFPSFQYGLSPRSSNEVARYVISLPRFCTWLEISPSWLMSSLSNDVSQISTFTILFKKNKKSFFLMFCSNKIAYEYIIK